jgi:diketogulonate reductase-like aldo/keto reductase
MLTRKIPSSGEAIPVIGMGTWETFDENPTDADAMKRLAEVLRTFYDAGGRVIDSSPMYGRSESVTGKISTDLKINGQLFIATKVWTRGQKAGVEQMQSSMQKLGREKLELMQIHNLIDWETHLKTLQAWKAEGTFRHIGITDYRRTAFDDLETIIKQHKIDFVQLPYSVDATDAEKRLIPAARDRGVAVLVMRPFGGGGLFEKVRGQELPEHAKAYAGSWAQAFLKFVLANESITAALPATSKPHHMADNVQAGTGRLPDERERKRLVDAIR